FFVVLFSSLRFLFYSRFGRVFFGGFNNHPLNPKNPFKRLFFVGFNNHPFNERLFIRFMPNRIIFKINIFKLK
ncbi:hypothetical protein, partial [Enterobacter asburiae]